ncbi:MAG: aspartyl-phosphate phosphatase Spo0E family protein [Prolixibacteraceae bacterium]|nr:aspartyl-phosphate phosphatase Spo0E family protein [Prolixibacteraceae bacterium]
MKNMENLMCEIEELRAQLNDQGKRRGLHDNDVLKKSEILDNLINQYYLLLRKETSKTAH